MVSMSVSAQMFTDGSYPEAIGPEEQPFEHFVAFVVLGSNPNFTKFTAPFCETKSTSVI
jgi:hypothetical protein